MIRIVTLFAGLAALVPAMASANTINVRCELDPKNRLTNINKVELTIDLDKKTARMVEHSTLDNKPRDKTWTNHKADGKVAFDESEAVVVSADRIKWGDPKRLQNAYIVNDKMMTTFEGGSKYQCKDAE